MPVSGAGVAAMASASPAESGNMPRLTAAAFCAELSAASRCRNGWTLAQLPGIAESIAIAGPARIAGERKHEGARARGAGVALGHQRPKQRQCLVALAADGEAERQPAPRFLGVGAVHCGPVIGLRLGLAAEQIVGEPAIAGEGRDRRAELLGAREIGQGRLGLAIEDRDRAHAGLGQRTSRIDLVGAGEEARRGMGVAQLDRRAAGADQRREILGVVGERAHVAGERGRGRLVIGRVAALGVRRRRHGRDGQAAKRDHPAQQSAGDGTANPMSRNPRIILPIGRESCAELSA